MAVLILLQDILLFAYLYEVSVCASDQTEGLVKKEETPVSAPDSVGAVLVWPAVITGRWWCQHVRTVAPSHT